MRGGTSPARARDVPADAHAALIERARAAHAQAASLSPRKPREGLDRIGAGAASALVQPLMAMPHAVVPEASSAAAAAARRGGRCVHAALDTRAAAIAPKNTPRSPPPGRNCGAAIAAIGMPPGANNRAVRPAAVAGGRGRGRRVPPALPGGAPGAPPPPRPRAAAPPPRPPGMCNLAVRQRATPAPAPAPAPAPGRAAASNVDHDGETRAMPTRFTPSGVWGGRGGPAPCSGVAVRSRSRSRDRGARARALAALERSSAEAGANFSDDLATLRAELFSLSLPAVMGALFPPPLRAIDRAAWCDGVAALLDAPRAAPRAAVAWLFDFTVAVECVGACERAASDAPSATDAAARRAAAAEATVSIVAAAAALSTMCASHGDAVSAEVFCIRTADGDARIPRAECAAFLRAIVALTVRLEDARAPFDCVAALRLADKLCAAMLRELGADAERAVDATAFAAWYDSTLRSGVRRGGDGALALVRRARSGTPAPARDFVRRSRPAKGVLGQGWTLFGPLKLARGERRDSVSDAGHHHAIEGVLLKRSRGVVRRWLPRFFKTQGHYLLYAASAASAAKGVYLGGVDVEGDYASVTRDGDVLTVVGLCADVHSGAVHERATRTFRLRALPNAVPGDMLRWEHHLLANQEKLRALGRCAKGEMHRAGASLLHDLGGVAVSAARVAADAHDKLVRSTAAPLLCRAMSAPELVVRSDVVVGGDSNSASADADAAAAAVDDDDDDDDDDDGAPILWDGGEPARECAARHALPRNMACLKSNLFELSLSNVIAALFPGGTRRVGSAAFVDALKVLLSSTEGRISVPSMESTLAWCVAVLRGRSPAPDDSAVGASSASPPALSRAPAPLPLIARYFDAILCTADGGASGVRVGESEATIEAVTAALSTMCVSHYGAVSEEIFRVYDTDGNGELSFEEIHSYLYTVCALMLRLRAPAASVDHAPHGQIAETLTVALFDSIDVDGSGSIDADEFTQWLVSIVETQWGEDGGAEITARAMGGGTLSGAAPSVARVLQRGAARPPADIKSDDEREGGGSSEARGRSAGDARWN